MTFKFIVFFLSTALSSNHFDWRFPHLSLHNFFLFCFVDPVWVWVVCNFPQPLTTVTVDVSSEVGFQLSQCYCYCQCVWVEFMFESVWRTLTGFLRVVLVFRRVCRSYRWGWWGQRWWRQDLQERNLWLSQRQINQHSIFHKLIHKPIKEGILLLNFQQLHLLHLIFNQMPCSDFVCRKLSSTNFLQLARWCSTRKSKTLSSMSTFCSLSDCTTQSPTCTAHLPTQSKCWDWVGNPQRTLLTEHCNWNWHRSGTSESCWWQSARKDWWTPTASARKYAESLSCTVMSTWSTKQYSPESEESKLRWWNRCWLPTPSSTHWQL